MRTRSLALAVCLMVLCTSAGWAKDPPKAHPGHFPIEELDLFGDRDQLSVEINLARPLLRLVAAATRGDEPEFAELIGSLESVRVRVAELENVDTEKIRGQISRAASWLDDHDWDVIVRTRDGDDENYIYSREEDGEIAGLAVLVIDVAGGEVVVVNIVGNIDWDQIEKLGEALDIPQLSQTPTPSDDKDSDQEKDPDHED